MAAEEIIEDSKHFFVKKGSWRNMEYLNVVLKNPVEIAVCIGEDKFVLNGILKFGKVVNHPPWENQLQIQFYCGKGTVRKEGRAHSNWDTVEINLPLEEGLDLMAKSITKLSGDPLGLEPSIKKDLRRKLADFM